MRRYKVTEVTIVHLTDEECEGLTEEEVEELVSDLASGGGDWTIERIEDGDAIDDGCGTY